MAEPNFIGHIFSLRNIVSKSCVQISDFLLGRRICQSHGATIHVKTAAFIVGVPYRATIMATIPANKRKIVRLLSGRPSSFRSKSFKKLIERKSCCNKARSNSME
jgi:hypothetical protein